MIRLEKIIKNYRMGSEEVRALQEVSLHIAPAAIMAIVGPSGSGKSTLMNIIGCLDIPDSGTYTLDGIPVDKMGEDQLADIRNEKIGFIFQQFNCLFQGEGNFFRSLAISNLYFSNSTYCPN
jgi:putative ABC transport system ATP-binding protein